MKETFGENVRNICRQFPDAPLVGAYCGPQPVMIPQDPELIKLIMTKDFYYFNGREISEHAHKEPAFYNVFTASGDYWKVLRQNMTPLFSTTKMKKMFDFIEKCCQGFENLLDKESSKVVELKDLMQRFTMQCIGACVFGVDTNTLENNVNNPFKNAGSDITDSSILLFIKGTIRSFWPAIFYKLGFSIFTKEIDTFKNILLAVFKQRGYKKTNNNDFVDLILGWKENEFLIGDSIKGSKSNEQMKVSIPIDDNVLLAHGLVFFIAGFETSALSSTYTLYELAKNKSALNKVCEEIDAYLLKHNNKIGYECTSELPYLDACLSEAMRLYPVLDVITREVMEDLYTSQWSQTRKRSAYRYSSLSLHHHPDHFPNPEEYRPERFYGDEKNNIKSHTYMPFGEGPRLCIGMRFAKMQTFAGLITILKKYRPELADGTPHKLKLRPDTLVTTPEDAVNVNLIERDGWEQRVYKRE